MKTLTGSFSCVLVAAFVVCSCGGGGGSVTNASVVDGSSGGTSSAPEASAPASVPVAPTPSASFSGNIVLGAPTSTSIKLSIFSPLHSGSIKLSYGTSPGVYDREAPMATLMAGVPLVQTLNSLSADTTYYYRLALQPTEGAVSLVTPEYSFHTARPAGGRFSFTIQADSHLDENSSLELYQRTLANVLADKPDFHIDLGDTFMTEKYAAPLTATLAMAPDQATVNTRYIYERGNFGRVTHSTPLFLVNGNHDAELGWLNTGTAQNNAVWASLARQRYFLIPSPDSFYGGDSVQETIVGQRASWYAWQWGDSLFVVLDPYWKSSQQASKDGWNLTLGDRQYNWLANTLAASRASYKFVFVHNLVGGLDGQMRGGIEAVPFFEWGGKNLDGTEGFASKRPGWSLPIHQLLVKNKVTAVFHGHDHLYAKQDLDGIVYQEVPQPSALNSNSGANLASDYHYSSGTILSSSGHLRVTVSSTGVRCEYVRAWLPVAETVSRKNGEIATSWSVGTP